MYALCNRNEVEENTVKVQMNRLACLGQVEMERLKLLNEVKRGKNGAQKIIE